MMVDKGVFAKRLLEFASSSLILDMALAQAQSRKLKNWWIVGGAVRDAVWCLIEGRDQASLIQDIDLLYFDSSDLSEEKDGDIEASLKPIEGIPWSVKNQARMHIKSNDAPYSSLQEALYCAPDTISTVCVTRSENCRWIIGSSFGYEDILTKVFRPTPHFLSKHIFEDYVSRVRRKGWLDRWPSARIVPW